MKENVMFRIRTKKFVERLREANPHVDVVYEASQKKVLANCDDLSICIPEGYFWNLLRKEVTDNKRQFVCRLFVKE